ncbi:hypothetical protein SDC9_132090 [bioreactor metagenome]|uniref:Uncharacterized protein n=1 Tax=bioreactor metagenome TaxID=1076179 RepID=A0A645D7U2_9ZZZZ
MLTGPTDDRPYSFSFHTPAAYPDKSPAYRSESRCDCDATAGHSAPNNANRVRPYAHPARIRPRIPHPYATNNTDPPVPISSAWPMPHKCRVSVAFRVPYMPLSFLLLNSTVTCSICIPSQLAFFIPPTTSDDASFHRRNGCLKVTTSCSHCLTGGVVPTIRYPPITED